MSKKKLKRGKYPQHNKTPRSLRLKKIEPITGKQSQAFEQWYAGKHLVLHGYPGTGKTFLGLYMAFEEVFHGNGDYDKVVIVRSAQSGKDIGHLPGRLDEKMAVYESPYMGLVSELFDGDEWIDKYRHLQDRKQLEFLSTSYNRGITLNNCIIVVDEIQNFSDSELHTIITRVGKNCRTIFCGDLGQIDLKKEKSGVHNFFNVVSSMNSMSFIEFSASDIIRSDFVREYIIAREELRLSGELKT